MLLFDLGEVVVMGEYNKDFEKMMKKFLKQSRERQNDVLEWRNKLIKKRKRKDVRGKGLKETGDA